MRRHERKNVTLKFNGKYSPSYLYIPADVAEKLPAVVLCHGNYIEGKDFEFIRRLADFLVDNGYAVLSFDNLCYNAGWRPESNEILSPEEIDFRWAAFAATTYLCNLNIVDKDRISIVGHSLGGTIALAAGAVDDRISSIVSISPTRVSRFIFDEKLLSDFHKTNVQDRLDTNINVSIMKAVRAVTLEETYIPFLKTKKLMLIYGRSERFWNYGKWIKTLSESIGENSRLEDIPRAGHYFGKQPDASDELVFGKLTDKLLEGLDTFNHRQVIEI